MRPIRFSSLIQSLTIVMFVTVAGAPADELQVVSMSPPRHALNASWNPAITINFDRPLAPATITADSFHVGGKWTGPTPGTVSFSNGNQTLTHTPSPTHTYSAGEIVSVTLSNSVQAADGSFIQPGGFTYMFWTKAAPAAREFNNIAVMSNRTVPQNNTRIYGAAAADLDLDGYLDFTTVNEDSHDLRVFMNKADGTGLYDPFLQPPHPIGIEASPNEVADFNHDGLIDIAAAASSSSSVWISLGNGDGTFDPSQEVPVGNYPHGLAVLDVDGDADGDIVTANTGGNNVSLMLNNGSGVFGPASSFEGGGVSEYGIASADMNNDGIFDIIVGTQGNRIIVHLGDGDGTFTMLPFVNAGGSVWMLTAADVNGDGNMDVTSANGGSNTGSILLGNGAGGLSAPTVMPTASHCVATDLGDLDGDGDLDWVLASFGGGVWRMFTNNGAGLFTFDQEFSAVSNPSCASLFDIDNDRDLDLVLTDEIADLVTLKKNRGPAVPGDMNCDGRIDGHDIAPFVLALINPAGYDSAHPHCLIDNGDIDVNTLVNTADIDPFAQLLTQ